MAAAGKARMSDFWYRHKDGGSSAEVAVDVLSHHEHHNIDLVKFICLKIFYRTEDMLLLFSELKRAAKYGAVSVPQLNCHINRKFHNISCCLQLAYILIY